jgi:hypothetical protein
LLREPRLIPAAQSAKTAKRSPEPADRLLSTVDELKAGKAGLATYLFLSAKGKDEVERELKAAFKLSDTQAGWIPRPVVAIVRACLIVSDEWRGSSRKEANSDLRGVLVAALPRRSCARHTLVG